MAHFESERWLSLSGIIIEVVFCHIFLIEIDPKHIKSSIQPVVLGQNNYLFNGANEAAQQTRLIY